jgi:hypothetical protein
MGLHVTYFQKSLAPRMPSVAESTAILKKRVQRLLRLDRKSDDQSELRQRILPFLNSLGEVALIGGAIRDLARGGRRSFNSDLDFVIYDGRHNGFLDAMRSSSAIANRFGGFSLCYASWKVDVWHIEDTWARSAGVRRVDSLSDLLLCTFFDWDSVVYDLKANQLICEADYLERIERGVINVRLWENPNPEGALVRALRRAALWRVQFGPELCEFSAQYLESTPWDSLVARDIAAFRQPVLKYLNREEIISRLKTSRTGVVRPLPVPFWTQEPSLPFEDHEGTDLSPEIAH